MQQTPKKRECRNCNFSRLTAESLHCVKNLRTPNFNTGEAVWPIVGPNDICGRFSYTDEKHIDADHCPRNDLPIYKDQFGDYCKIPLAQGRFTALNFPFNNK